MTTPRADDAARRAYWTSQLEAAYTFMQSILSYPVEENGEPLVSLIGAARDAKVEVEFSTKKHALGLDRQYFLRRGQIAGFIAAAREMNQRGWVMKVEDGYRSRQMQKFLGREPAVFDGVLRSVIWELEGKTPTPEMFLRRSMTLVALIPKIGTHMSGSAIDISVFNRVTRREIDRGGPYLELSELTPMESPFISKEALANRLAIRDLMRRHGFMEYPFEFWHYNSGDAYAEILLGSGKPAKYGAVDWSGNADGRVTPMDRPCDALNSPEEIRVEIDKALKRFAAK